MSYSLKNESNGANEVPRCPRAGGGATLVARNADGFIGGTLVARAALSFGPKYYSISQISFPVSAASFIQFKMFGWLVSVSSHLAVRSLHVCHFSYTIWLMFLLNEN